MGQTLTIKCPKCGKEFEWRNGGGFITRDTLHCDKCGRQRVVRWDKVLEPAKRVCRCGGVFSSDAPVRCPKCKTEVADVEANLIGIAMWD